jgi:hypothetical protein
MAEVEPAAQCVAGMASLRSPTFITPGRRYQIDHAVVFGAEAAVSAAVDFLSDEREREATLRAGLPNDIFASDHVPIAVNVQVVGVSIAQMICGPGAAAQDTTAEELWAACPLPPDARAELESQLADEADARPSGKGKVCCVPLSSSNMTCL